MTINIDIYLSPNDGDMGAQLDDHMKALGFSRSRAATLDDMRDKLEEDAKARAEGKNLDGSERRETITEAALAPARKRGEPSPGKARRTKAEIAEDEAAEQAEAKGAISESPEDRQDPANPEVVDDEETAAQDAADEAAETAAEKAKTGGKLTLDDVRNVIGLYVKAYGMPAAQEDGPKIIASVCGEGAVKVSDIPEDKIGDVIEAIKAAGRANTYKREAVVQS